MGYPVDLFIEENINQEFLCSICQDVLKEATLLEPCEHAFCKECIEEWHRRNNTCPIDRLEIEELKKPPRIYMNLLNGLQMKCQFKAAGCNEILALADLAEHNGRCEFNPENKRPCAIGCGAVVNRIHEPYHSCVAYLKDQLQAVKTELQTKEDELQQATGDLHAKSLELSATTEKLDRYRSLILHLSSRITSNRTTQSAAVPTAVARAETSPSTSTRARACPARYKVTTASASGVTLSLDDSISALALTQGQRNPQAAIASESTSSAIAAATSVASAPTRRRPCPARFQSTAPYPARSPAARSSSMNLGLLAAGYRILAGRAPSSQSTSSGMAAPPPPTRRSTRASSASCRPCPARFKK